jgi:hypothetical protein
MYMLLEEKMVFIFILLNPTQSSIVVEPNIVTQQLTQLCLSVQNVE